MKPIILIFSALLLAACSTQKGYVPVETVKTEYRDKYIRDSVHVHDSVFVNRYLKGDTVFQDREVFKYFYKDKLKTDTVATSDTIRIPYPVTEYKEVKRLSSFQHFQVWCGRIFLLTIFIWIGKGIYLRRLL